MLIYHVGYWFTKKKSQGIKENDYVTNLQYINFFHVLEFQFSYISFFFFYQRR